MKKNTIRSTFWYDVTREMRRLAQKGRLEEAFPDRARAIDRILRGGGRIVFSPDEEEFYEELVMDQVLLDPNTGKTCGVRRL